MIRNLKMQEDKKNNTLLDNYENYEITKEDYDNFKKKVEHMQQFRTQM